MSSLHLLPVGCFQGTTFFVCVVRLPPRVCCLLSTFPHRRHSCSSSNLCLILSLMGVSSKMTQPVPKSSLVPTLHAPSFSYLHFHRTPLSLKSWGRGFTLLTTRPPVISWVSGMELALKHSSRLNKSFWPFLKMKLWKVLVFKCRECFWWPVNKWLGENGG